MSVSGHRDESSSTVVRCAIITCSDTRTYENDASGDLIESLVKGAGHEVVSRQIVIENPDSLRLAFRSAFSHADAVIITGGTGIAHRDRTPDVIEPELDRPLPGFGELFRHLSYREIGAAALLSRAFAGVKEHAVIFALPGSTAAVRLALQELILPELRHIVRQISL